MPFRSMHHLPLLLAALAGSCLPRPGLSLLHRSRHRADTNDSHNHNSSSRRRMLAFGAATAPTAIALRPTSPPEFRCQPCAASPQAHLAPVSRVTRPRHLSSSRRVCCVSWLPAREDPDSDDYYNDRGRIDPPAQEGHRRFTGEEEGDRGRGSRGAKGSAGRGRSGRAGTSAGRGVSGRRSTVPSAGAPTTTTPTTTTTTTSGDVDSGRAGKGIDQDDPLVKNWNSAKALNPSRDEFPLGGRSSKQVDAGGGRGDGGRQGGQRRYVQDSAGRRGGGRGGRGRGRGRGRGSVQPVGMYMGNDKIPWYIKEVQDKGLDMEGSFDQWWKDNLDPAKLTATIKEMKVDELKAQLAKMGLPTKGVKAVLIERLAEGLLKFSLSDDNFQHAPVTDTTVNDKDLPNCFPQVYESLSEKELENLWKETTKKKKEASKK